MKIWNGKPWAVAAVVSIAACAPDVTEIGRVPSPDGATSAVVVMEAAGGAAGSLSYDVYLMGAAHESSRDKPVFSGTHCDALSPVWETPSVLKIHYKAGCHIYGYRNIWYEKTESAGDRTTRTVEVVLVREAG